MVEQKLNVDSKNGRPNSIERQAALERDGQAGSEVEW